MRGRERVRCSSRELRTQGQEERDATHSQFLEFWSKDELVWEFAAPKYRSLFFSVLKKRTELQRKKERKN
jgi:hypothetical protein